MFFETRDGTKLAYEDYGQGDPILFVHGAMLSTDMWEYQFPYFVERGYRVIGMDRRGHGRSDRPSTGYDIETGADDLADLIEHLDLRDFTVITHSMGGHETVSYLNKYGEDRVARLALVSALLPFMKQTDDNPHGIPEALIEATLAQVQRNRPRWLANQAQAYFATNLFNDVSPAMIESVIAQCLTPSPWAVLQSQRAVLNTDLRKQVAAVTVPTLIVHGDADFSAPIDVTGRRTAELLPKADYKEYPGAGHGVYITHQDQLNADLLAFIQS
ncbi:alpha/beta fold hydrolase [Nonomuraea sediminis]|uniref:alpha/beta fold hydrolase n=1 Tax=Nonomuraea sediminis TaxID=2835864 RepID=UPI001BDC7C6C|nr:alpha/beta hydrolase [Nonomuraea sediminis]